MPHSLPCLHIRIEPHIAADVVCLIFSWCSIVYAALTASAGNWQQRMQTISRHRCSSLAAAPPCAKMRSSSSRPGLFVRMRA